MVYVNDTYEAICRIERLPKNMRSVGGTVRFLRLPALTERDYDCDPPALLGPEEVTHLSEQISEAKVGTLGKFGEVVWILWEKQSRT